MSNGDVIIVGGHIALLVTVGIRNWYSCLVMLEIGDVIFEFHNV